MCLPVILVVVVMKRCFGLANVGPRVPILGRSVLGVIPSGLRRRKLLLLPRVILVSVIDVVGRAVHRLRVNQTGAATIHVLLVRWEQHRPRRRRADSKAVRLFVHFGR